MDENDLANLDLDFKRYLQLLRPYLMHLANENVVKLCDTWIQRLSDCKDDEKVLRNKYIFLLCYQLARGIFDKPFLSHPPSKLQDLSDDLNSDDSSSEVEDLVKKKPKTRVLYNSKNLTVSESDYLSQDDDKTGNENANNHEKYEKRDTTFGSGHSQTIICYRCPELQTSDHKVQGDEYELRANNLIKKLREIKMQNLLLNRELTSLREESKCAHVLTEGLVNKVDIATSPIVHRNDSSATLNSLRHQLQEIQDSRNVLIETISNLQNQLDNFNELKRNEIDDIEAKHKLELIKVRTDARDETKLIYDKKFEELRQSYENTIAKIQQTAEHEINAVTKTKDEIISEKNKLLDSKDKSIAELTNQIEAQKTTVHSMITQFIEKSSEDVSCQGLRIKNQLLEKRLNKIEKSKLKCTKIFDSKLSQLQRDKHLAECSLQLQLVRQRAQIVSEISDDNQTELNTSLDKLESKYKDIVANIQATAIQRRIQDQRALECLMQTVCGFDGQNQYSNPLRNPNQSYESESTSFARNNRVGNVAMGAKSFGEDSVMPGFCLNGDRMGELFERVHIPQRDNCNAEAR
ncbi:unnamed protein product [Arctia plantaginis]|uniref:DUF4485 domain-containing protein n=1 Tax=Arctia plantaginis TaxID=874455 RepID=A0A8S1B3K2_ARCPL|nr:unnamed protein product [Arctia plantaginis]